MSDAEANRVLPNRLRLYIALIAVAGAGWLAYLVQDAQWGLSSLGEMGLIVGAGSFPLHVSPRLKADVTTAVLFCGALAGCGRKVRRSAAAYGASTVSAAFGM